MHLQISRLIGQRGDQMMGIGLWKEYRQDDVL
jgi:hypothetical protein